MRTLKPESFKAVRPMYLLSYRPGLNKPWYETVPMYDRTVVKRNESYYASEYGWDNVRVEPIYKGGKKPRAPRPERREEDEDYSDYEV